MNAQLEQFLTLLRRYPWCVVCVVLALLGGGAVGYLYYDIDHLAEPYATKSKEYEEMLNLTKGGLIQRQELEFAQEATRRIDSNLLIETELADNQWYFYKFEEQTKARLGELHPLSSPNTDTSPLFRRIPYTLRVSGTYDQVAAFILAVETGPRLAKVTSFTLNRQAAAAKDSSGAAGDSAPEPATGNVALDMTIELLGKK